MTGPERALRIFALNHDHPVGQGTMLRMSLKKPIHDERASGRSKTLLMGKQHSESTAAHLQFEHDALPVPVLLLILR
jgi:hypothetical protein